MQRISLTLSKPGYPTLPAPDNLLDTNEVVMNYIAAIPLNAMTSTDRDFIMDSGAGRTGTSDMSLLKNVKQSTATTVTAAAIPVMSDSGSLRFMLNQKTN